MNQKEFNKLLDRRINLIRKVLDAKNKEYASDSDKLHNFKRAADMLNCTAEKALIGMWTKHIISLLDIVDKIEDAHQQIEKLLKGEIKVATTRVDEISNAMIEEKIGDAINYLILLEALIKERYDFE